MTIREHFPLKDHNTFRLNATARYWCEYASEAELVEVLHRFADVPKCFIGDGSNLLFIGDFEGVVMRSAMRRAAALRETDQEVWIEAQSGLRMDDLIEQVAAMQLYGLENLSHIPGQVGAAAVQNVGAYGVEAKDVIEEVHTLDVQTLQPRIFTNAECRYGYRDSFFKREGKGRYIITSVIFRLSKAPVLHLDYGNLRSHLADIETPSPEAIRQAVIAIRQQKLPEVTQFGSAGSFFKNPIVPSETYQRLLTRYPAMPSYQTPDGYKIPAAWLIEQCGWKGQRVGGAAVWQAQPLVLYNTGDASSDDVQTLAAQIIASVQQQFDINLQREAEYI